MGWSDGPVVKIACYSCQGPGISFWFQHGDSQTYVTPDAGDTTASLASEGIIYKSVHIYMQSKHLDTLHKINESKNSPIIYIYMSEPGMIHNQILSHIQQRGIQTSKRV